MAEGFTKLKPSIIHSTIWREENHVRILWITMLAMSNGKGEVMGSIPGLADAARISIGECKEGLEHLMSPDPYSRTKEHEGRRISDMDGGWKILNYEKHREPKSTDRVKAWRDKRRNETVATVSNGFQHGETDETASEADTEAKNKIKEKQKTARELAFVQFYEAYPNKKSRQKASDTWDKLWKKKKLPPIEKVIDAVAHQTAMRAKYEQCGQWIEPWKHPSSWLNSGSWEDQIKEPKENNRTTSKPTGPTTTEALEAFECVLVASRNGEYQSLPERHKQACKAAGGLNELRTNKWAKNDFIKCFKGE